MLNKKVRLKAKVTFEWEYDAEPRYYCQPHGRVEDITVEKIIEADKMGFKEDEYMFLESCTNDPTIEITEVK